MTSSFLTCSVDLDQTLYSRTIYTQYYVNSYQNYRMVRGKAIKQIFGPSDDAKDPPFGLRSLFSLPLVPRILRTLETPGSLLIYVHRDRDTSAF